MDEPRRRGAFTVHRHRPEGSRNRSCEMGRKFVGAELKQSYFEQAAKNIAAAEQEKTQDLFAA